MAIPTLLEADVLLNARDEFRRRPDLQLMWGVTAATTPEQLARIERRYADAVLKDYRDDPLWPGNAGNPTK